MSLALLTLLAPGTTRPDASEQSPALSQRFRDWLTEVEPLITHEERRVFLSLEKDYQRDAFIRKFWQVRDPFPETGRNELRERWEVRAREVQQLYGGFGDDRARIFLVHGKPHGGFDVRCTKTRKPAEVWYYARSDQVDFQFLLIFLRPNGVGPARLWRPGMEGFLESILASTRNCINGRRLSGALESTRSLSGNYAAVLQHILSKPRPRNEEWVRTFTTFSTDLPADAETLTTDLDLQFLGRHQSRTVVQGLITVPTDGLGQSDFAGYHSYDFLLIGEVIRESQLFESFRYKFGFPTSQLPSLDSIPLAFQRYLRPGNYDLIVKLQDLNSAKVARHQLRVEVPMMDEVVTLPDSLDRETAEIFAEATAAVASSDNQIKIIPPSSDLQMGYVRFDTLATGADISRVVFILDGKPVLTKNRPPFNVELDLGDFPDFHTLRVEALDFDGEFLSHDELLLNSGGQRFTISLLEPRRGKTYSKSLRAQAEVQVPDGSRLERVEFYLNETLVATLYQPPFVQPMLLATHETLAYVRSIAYLEDGNSTEDVVFVNSPDYLEEIDIQFVELYTTVLDKYGRPVDDLTLDDFTVFEDGSRQQIRRFEKVQDLSIHAGILLDNSASMMGALDRARRAALSFFEQAITVKDRAAVITFNSHPNLAVKFTNDLRTLGGGLAGLTAEGGTALYDSLMFGLYYFTGIKGQRAILILSDGKDESSRFSFEDTLEYARRAGVTLYAIGLNVDDGDARYKLGRLAEETGGATFFIQDIAEVEAIYNAIQQELRSQYLIAYQSSNQGGEKGFRTVDLKVKGSGLSVRTLSGYYP